MVFEILGCNLLSIVRLYKSKGLPLPLVKIITKQLLIALDFLHTDCSIIHTDLKPENVLLRLNPDLSLFGGTSAAMNEKEDKTASGETSVVAQTVESTHGGTNGLCQSDSKDIVQEKSEAATTATTAKDEQVPTESNSPSLLGLSINAVGSSTTSELNNTEKRNEEEENQDAKGEEESLKVTSEAAETSSSLADTASQSGSSRPTASEKSTSTLSNAASKITESPSSQMRRKSSERTNASSSSAKSPRNADNQEAQTVSLPSTREGLLQVFGGGAFKCKIADLGNACWTFRHFTEDVQTRHYRAPEVILGFKSYDTPIDMWSLGCIVFELLTGDLLFEPHAGKNYTKDDDHLAQIIELLGKLPRELVIQGKYSSDYLTRRGDLRNIRTLHFWALKDVLMEKYKYPQEEASSISSFLLPMLEYTPTKRATARERLRHPWIRNVDVNNFESAFD